jgi:hypothetical protein
MASEIQIKVDGDLVIETTSISKEFNKEEFLAQKLQELEDHNKGVAAYLEAANIKKEELEDIINKLK